MSDPCMFSADDLLAHASFLRRLAGELVGADEAEDLVQDAWVAALERPPRTRASLRGWLAAVVSNLGRNARRGRAHRSQREEHVARPEREEPGALALERLELQRVLGELIVGLSEEQRTVLYLRYFEDLAPTAIAARLGVPVKTVKTRHTRALAALRARMDERSGGDRAAWVAVLAPWARLERSSIAGAALVMLAAAALVVAAGLFAWRARTPRHAATPVEVAREPVRTAATPELASREASPATVRTSAPASSGPACVLEGTLRLREDGSLLAGVSIEVRFRGAEPVGRACTTTDENGSYRFEWPEPVSVWWLVARATGATAAASGASVRVSPGETERVDLSATRGAPLEGTVVDENGAPVAGARVQAWCLPGERAGRPADRVTESAWDGTFRLEHLGEEFVLVADAPGLVCGEGLQGKLDPGSTASGLSVTLRPPYTFHGHVLDERGRPIAGARLARPDGSNSSSDRDATHVAGIHRFVAGAMEAVSDERGAFELGPYPAARCTVRVSCPPFKWADVEIDARQADNALVLADGFTLRGRVIGSDGQPARGARIRVESGTRGSALTDDEGAFEVHGLDECENAFVHVDADHDALLAVQPVRIGAGSRFLELHLQPPLALAGRALDPSGRPVVDALVRIEGDRVLVFDDVVFAERTTWEWLVGANETRTDGDGRFRFERLYDGEYDLQVVPEGAPGWTTRVRTRAGRADLEIVVDPSRDERLVLTGRVTDAFSGAPVTSARFTVMRPDPGFAPARQDLDLHLADASARVSVETFDSWTGKSIPVEWSADGTYRASGLDPGKLYVAIEAPGYARQESEVREYGLGRQRIDFRLVPSCSLQLVLARGAGCAQADVRFFDLDGGRLWLLDSASQSSDVAHIRWEPTSVAGLPRQLVRLVATAPGFVPRTLELDLSVPPSEPVELALARERP